MNETYAPILRIHGLHIETIKQDATGAPRAEKLLHNLEVSAYPKEIVLLLGPSGSGKSLLTNLLLGFLSPLERGIVISPAVSSSCFELNLDGQIINLLNPIYPKTLEAKIGVMFQSLGLFDDLTVEENWSFANDQSLEPRQGLAWSAWKREMITKLDLPPNILSCNINKLSGGQKQRVAFGRLLAFRPKIMIFDEPTSSLDISTAQQVVSLVQQTHEQNQNILTLVITHDYENFLRICHRVWFISHTQEVQNHAPAKPLPYYAEDLCTQRTPNFRELSQDEFLQHEARSADALWNTALSRLLRGISKALRPQSYVWWWKFFTVMFKLLVIRASPYMLITGFFLGLVATYFSLNLDLGSVRLYTGTAVKVERFLVPTFFREMLSGFGIVMFRALIPLFTCIFIAARSGTAITAYLSSMRDSERRQWDAMRNLGIEPYLFFLPQILICFVLGCWILSYIAFLSSALGSLFIALATNPLCTWYTWIETFWMHLHPEPLLGLIGFIPIFEGFGMFTLKTTVAGFAIAMVSFLWGVKIRKTSMDTLRHLISANIWNMLAILIIFFVLLILELA